jgi:type IV pilus assembly protein PilA
MLARVHKAMEKRDEGFTLIELLVVIIIIGILAAIAIPVFLNQRKKGYDAASKSELKSISTAEESYATANNGKYSDNSAGELKAEGYNQSVPYTDKGGLVVSVTASADAWCAVVTNSAATDVTWAQSSTTGAPAKGTCDTGVFK